MNAIAEQDQIQAAIKESQVIFQRILKSPAKERVLSYAPSSWASDIVASRCASTFTSDPTLMGCAHLSSPRPLFLPSWVNAIVCINCVQYLPSPTGDEDRICDGCGAADLPLTAALVQINLFTVIGGLCPTCKSLVQEGRVEE